YSELFATKASHHRSVDDGPAQVGVRNLPVARVDTLSGQIADIASGEAVAGAGGIEHLLQEIAGNHEVGVLAEQDSPVFAALDHQRMRSHEENLFRRSAKIIHDREQPRFAVIDQQKIP